MLDSSTARRLERLYFSRSVYPSASLKTIVRFGCFLNILLLMQYVVRILPEARPQQGICTVTLRRDIWLILLSHPHAPRRRRVQLFALCNQCTGLYGPVYEPNYPTPRAVLVDFVDWLILSTTGFCHSAWHRSLAEVQGTKQLRPAVQTAMARRR